MIPAIATHFDALNQGLAEALVSHTGSLANVEHAQVGRLHERGRAH